MEKQNYIGSASDVYSVLSSLLNFSLFTKHIFHLLSPNTSPEQSAKLQIQRKTTFTTNYSGSDFLNSSPPGQNGRYFADDIFRCIFMNESFCILIKISLKFVPRGPIDNNQHWFR